MREDPVHTGVLSRSPRPHSRTGNRSAKKFEAVLQALEYCTVTFILFQLFRKLTIILLFPLFLGVNQSAQNVHRRTLNRYVTKQKEHVT